MSPLLWCEQDSSLTSLCFCSELWKVKRWERITSPHLSLRRTVHWFTLSPASRGSDVGSTTSCFEKTPFQDTAEQYVARVCFYSYFYSVLSSFSIVCLLFKLQFSELLKHQLSPSIIKTLHSLRLLGNWRGDLYNAAGWPYRPYSCGLESECNDGLRLCGWMRADMNTASRSHKREQNVQTCTLLFCLHSWIWHFTDNVLTNDIIPQVKLIWVYQNFIM